MCSVQMFHAAMTELPEWDEYLNSHIVMTWGSEWEVAWDGILVERRLASCYSLCTTLGARLRL